jgi:uncharacterized metal-binding protein YceD (DUF177 family)
MIQPEFSRPVRLDTLGDEPRHIEIAAEPEEREALARRFGLAGIAYLSAKAEVRRRGSELGAKGVLKAKVTQRCVASAVPVEQTVDEDFAILFRPQPARAREEDEIELGAGDLDVVFYDGAAIDLGEAVAESLSLSLDPYPRAPNAEAALREAGVKSEEDAGPFGALAGLRDKLKS